MKQMMQSEFSFFKAGQGSFYGGRIRSSENSKSYTIIYDCGTCPFVMGNSQSLNNEIDFFKYKLGYTSPMDVIDLLFISHLDYDHVSGLKRLLMEFKIRRIILPYFDRQERLYSLVSFFSNDPASGDLPFEDYFSLLKDPSEFVQVNSEQTEIFFISSDGDKDELDYLGYDTNRVFQDIYPIGTTLSKDSYAELVGTGANVYLYKNNLQFFIQREWEFTTFVKGANKGALNKFGVALKKILKKRINEALTLDDLEEIVLKKRKDAHKCYTDYIGEINSHGLVLLHGPIGFSYLECGVYSDSKLSPLFSSNGYYHYFYDDHDFRSKRSVMLGTLLLGDTSINPKNNQIIFSRAFTDKLVNVHTVQAPHHGSFENWSFEEFLKLQIGDSFNRWGERTIAVCNFGYGNTYGHPSHKVLDDLRSSIFLNSQFSRLNIEYHILY